MIEEKQRLVRLLNEYIDGPGLTVVIGAEHPDPNLRSFSLIASTYDDGTGIGTRRRHRADAHALFACDCRRRRRGAGRVARAPRSELSVLHAVTEQLKRSTEKTASAGGPDRPTTRRTPARTDSPKLRASATTMRDRWLRKTAEFDNYRKRIERERREQADQAIVDLLAELLLVVDDFDRALTVEAGRRPTATARASS